MQGIQIPADHSIRLIPLDEVIRLSGRGRTRIYAGVKSGEFPAPIKDGASSRWNLLEVHQWIRDRVAARDARKGS